MAVSIVLGRATRLLMARDLVMHVALLLALVLFFPAVGILFPDERLPGPGWRGRSPVAAVLLAIGVVLSRFTPWTMGQGGARTRSRSTGLG